MTGAMPLGPFGGTSELYPVRNRRDLYVAFLETLCETDKTFATVATYAISQITIFTESFTEANVNVIAGLNAAWTPSGGTPLAPQYTVGERTVTATVMSVPVGEYLNGVRGWCWAYSGVGAEGTGISGLQFSTGNGNWSEQWGTAATPTTQDGANTNVVYPFWVELPPGYQIIGFFGSTTDAGFPLASLGVYVAPVPG